MRLLFFFLLLIYVVLASQSRAFEVGTCVFNKQYQQVKRIKDRRLFTYRYCIYDGASQCKGNYTVRKDWFNKNHKSVKCPITKEIFLEMINEGELVMSEVGSVEVLLEEGSEGAKGSKDFPVSFFKCSHCHVNGVKQEIIDTLQEFKNFISMNVFVTSGYRCRIHNKNVGGVSKSYHTKGLAADIRVIDQNGKWLSGSEIAALAEESGLFENGGIGTYKTFCHLDVRGKHARWEKV